MVFTQATLFLRPHQMSELGAYPTILRPKELPKVDWLTATCIKALWYLGYMHRESRLLTIVLLKTRLLHLAAWFYHKLMVRRRACLTGCRQYCKC